MKTHITLGVSLIAFTLASLPLQAAPNAPAQPESISGLTADTPLMLARQGRGRGGDDDRRGRDDDRRDRGDDDRREHHGDDGRDGSGSGRDKPRIPGGSGCDDAGDIEEHAECSA